ncbi:type II secretion system pilot lipoprotein GspS [Pantoea dispersa]|uniref:type II secretion system pilot lipoprotein GspS n=1 Tax=Pantoea dispersa TaxID=59814 RepID=UPI0039B47D81
MKHTRSAMVVLSLSLALLSGCQQRQSAKRVTTEQVNQLAALIASAEWLRDRCQRSDIPLRPAVEEAAIKMAKQRGWQMSAVTQQDVNNAVEQRYLALSEDNVLINHKCAQLNQAAAPFIQQINSV